MAGKPRLSVVRSVRRRGGEGGRMIRILIADDHAVVRRGLRQILAEADDLLVAAEASTAAEVIQRVQSERFDVVVLDIGLPGGSGIDSIGDIRRVRPEARVLILTMFS